MTSDELKIKIQEWANQINIYNEGCVCDYCISQIQSKINAAFDEYKQQLTQKSQ